ncbi:MAG: sigma-70 family RNA polymerase sigma factor [Sedimentisphaerales bacterium]|nr:sigma-70 family RNA polymerase sigma factor [Sedimentisphaerales bacterium]
MILSNYDYPRLVIESRNGDHTSRDLLAQKVQSDIRPYVYRMLYNKELTDDITQETLLKVFELIHTIREPEKFRCWLYRMARGKVQLCFRYKKKFDMSKATIADDYMSDNTMNGLTQLIQEELSEAIVNAMDTLKESHRDILVLRIYQNLSYKEIAEILSCSSLAAKVQFYRAKQALKKKLKGHGFNKSMLLPALLIFGKLTSQATAQTALPVMAAKTLMVSPAAVLLGSGLSYLTVSVIVIVSFMPWQDIKQSVTEYFQDRQYETQICVPLGLSTIVYNNQHLSEVQEYRRLADIREMDQHFSKTGYEVLNLVIEPGESVEFKFPGIISNGPGEDIYIVELGPAGESVEVYLRDDKNNEIYLGRAASPRIDNQYRSVVVNYPITSTFDLSRYKIDFNPTRIKLVGSHSGGVIDGFELHRIQARVKMPKGMGS